MGGRTDLVLGGKLGACIEGDSGDRGIGIGAFFGELFG